MQGNIVRNYYISEGVKALFSVYFKDQTEENFIKALNEFNKENQINSQEIKDEALREIKEELSKLATTDLLNAKIDKVEAKIDKVEASLNAKIDKVEASLNAKIDKVDTRIDKVENKIDKVEASLNAKIDKVDTRIDKVENKLDSFKTEVKTYVIILAALMFILQPTIFDLIKSIFK
ncbi:coiled-coil domain-containing protein [Campylobacter coli]|uniref:coiled-coil domain-containing protein n=1 Tax=Campylobacter coli TaxID=195 RepID=UPI0008752268|nr:DUF1640 domain-containing protein [Campylobacter coli]EAJ0945913.1 DUF1640 domain-containing protein [Campylobacter jejuni]EAI0449330.1 DUF1640 domain-containing protein [Campylobacter coli]EAI4223254.1 DUF1640 domain-containing protein [Campylobacter coli]EAI6537546.1 DUF1640 domain-containing protein [Campylobacter coli]EAI7846285.1 DUF1640 domain-containing protein [Campylobacter coli]